MRDADRGPAAFAWGVSQGLWGAERLTIAEDGSAATLRSELCQLRSRRNGIPDEGMPTLEVASAEHTCKVTLWDGEWEEMPAARPARDAVHQIIRRIKES